MLASAQDNLHSQMSSIALAARVNLARGAYERALTLVETGWDRTASFGMQGDYLATKAMVYACCDGFSEAQKLLEASQAISDQIDGRVLRCAVRAIIAHKEDPSSNDTRELITHVVGEARSTGNLDALVSAYRAHPHLLEALDRLETVDLQAVQRLVQQTDPKLAEKAGFRLHGLTAALDDPLTRREREVFDLMRQGMTNREIARSMWIEESTVKVHVRHILRKFSARSRTEAVARGNELFSPPRPETPAER
jgi:DNA-binding NarL/FixJ family response regulator